MKLAFIGGGNMARSLIGGLLRGSGDSQNAKSSAAPAPGSDTVDNNHLQIVVSDPVAEVLQNLSQDFGVRTAANNQKAVEQSEVIVFAVKPQQMHTVISAMKGCFDDKLIISIAAGVRCADIALWAGNTNVALVRCMPNTPALLQCGATGLFASDNVSRMQRTNAEKILSAAGSIAWVYDESQLDAITALSGSGPAYFFLLLEAMTESATALGLPKDLATKFAIQTAMGASRMASESDIAPAQLRQNVTSPAGTTEAALNSFNSDNFTNIVMRAMQAANDRAAELGEELSNKPGEKNNG